MISIKEKEYNQLTEYLKSKYGINLGKEKKTLVEGRLANVLAEKNFNSFSQFFDYLISDKTGEALTTLVNKITTNHTFFMREPSHFDYFRDTVLPYLTSIHSREKDLRIWSAGCSTGEEPYTLAMIIADYFAANFPQSEKSLWDTKILATDISEKVLDKAVKGEYADEQLLALSKNWRLKYFSKTANESSVVSDKIKNEIIFRKFNLMNTSLPFKKKFHVIFCRNVMIYFDSKTRNELVERFYEVTEPGGYLFIGHSESLNRGETRYNYIMPAVYRKG